MSNLFKPEQNHPITVVRIPIETYNRDWSKFNINIQSIIYGRLLHIYLVSGTDTWIHCGCSYENEHDILLHIGKCAYHHAQGITTTTELSSAKILPVEMLFMNGWLLV